MTATVTIELRRRGAVMAARRAAEHRLASAGAIEASPEAVARATGWAARLVPGAACLARAIVGEALLRGAGVDAVLRLGFARDDGAGVRGHAWVVVDGRPVVGHPAGTEQWQSLPPMETPAP